MGSEIKHIFKRKAERDRKIIAIIPFTFATYRQVYGNHQCFLISGKRPGDQLAQKRLVAQNIGHNKPAAIQP